jgi:hypothetical protein
MGREVKCGVIVTARDETKTALESVKSNMHQLSAVSSKTAGALSLVDAAGLQMGESLGVGVSKVTALASGLASGGPLGVGIALTVAAIGGLKEILELQNAEVDAFGVAMRSLDAINANTAKGVDDLHKRVLALKADQPAWGLSGSAAELAKDSDARKRNSTALEGQTKNLAYYEDRLKAAQAEEKRGRETTSGQSMGMAGTVQVQTELGRTIEANAKTERLAAEAAIKFTRDRLAQLEKEKADLGDLITLTKTKASVETAAENNRKAHERPMDEVVGFYTKTMEAREKAINSGLKREFRSWSQYYDRLADESERQDKAQQKIDEARQRRNESLAMGVSSAWGNALAEMVMEEQSAGQAMGKAAIESARIAIEAAAFVAAGRQFASHAWLPGIGIAMGAAAASAILVAIEQLISRLPSAEMGFAGTANRDSVPVMVMPGERVITKEGARLRDHSPSVGNVVLNAKFDTPRDDAEMERLLLRRFVPALQRLNRNGAFALAR